MKSSAGRLALVLALTLAASVPLRAQTGWSSDDQVRVSFVSSVPGAVIRLNGAPVGETPLTLRIRPGRYSLQVSKPGYDAYLASIEITNRPAQTFRITLRPGGLPVQIAANVLDAAVYVNGRLVGTTPANLELAPGRYTVRLESPGYRSLETSLQITPDQSARRFVFNLQPASSRLVIRVPAQYLTAPEDAGRIRIYVDGRLAADGAARIELELEAGIHTVRIASPPGGLTVSRELRLEAGRTYQLDLLMDLVAR